MPHGMASVARAAFRDQFTAELVKRTPSILSGRGDQRKSRAEVVGCVNPGASGLTHRTEYCTIEQTPPRGRIICRSGAVLVLRGGHHTNPTRKRGPQCPWLAWENTALADASG